MRRSFREPWRERPRGRRGQATLELALTITMLMLFLMAIFDLGRAVFYYSDLCQAAREGSRYAALLPPNQRDVEVVKMHAQQASLIQVPTSSITVTYSTGHPLSAEVEMTYRYRPITPLIAAITGQNGFVLWAISAVLIE